MADFFKQLDHYVKQGRLPEKFVPVLRYVYESYSAAMAKKGSNMAEATLILQQYLELIAQQIAEPYTFELFHTRTHDPINYHELGLKFFRPLVDFSGSKVLGKENLENIIKQLNAKDNVILFGNHQVEPDPQIINLLLEHDYPQFAEDIIFVAGQRVVTDPMAVPFSLGCNLLCIYSKKYIDNPPEEKEQKQLHNQRTMKKMSQLLAEGGKCIYVAPSGGRDRRNAQGDVEIAEFDPQSIEMFWLMAKHAQHPTHFYPLALSTFHITPPPAVVQAELGEERELNYGPVGLSFGKEIDMEDFPGDKKEKRQLRATFIHSLVKKDYAKLISFIPEVQ